VAFPILSRLQSGSQDLQLAHRNSAALLALYGFGVCWGLAAVAPEFVGVVLGDKWLKAVYPLAMLSIVAPLRMLCAFNNTVVTAIGKPQAATYEQVLASALLPTIVGLAAYLDGLFGAALAWVLAYPVVFLFSNWLTARTVKISLRVALRTVAAPVAAGLCMMAAVWGCRAVLGEVMPQGLRLAAGIVCGAATYLGVLWVIARPLLVDAWTLASDLLRPKPDK
jgi:PST family polysaccharide transporter